MSQKAKSVDFEIIKEPWNKYEISDGSILKTRFILKKVDVTTIDEKNANYNIDGQNLNVVYVSQELKGTPTDQTYSPIELKNAVVKDELRYNTIHEEWNEYLLDDATRIRIKTTVVKISRTNKYDKSGDPIYLIDTSGMMEIKRPQTFP